MSILTTKRVRELYGMAVRWDSDEKTAAIRESNLAEFDAWIAQHDREVRAEALNGARAELQAAYKRGPGARLDGLESTWRKGVAKAHRIVRDCQDRLWTDGAA